MLDKYASFAELQAGETLNEDYSVHLCERPAAAALIVAPHGGSIEIGTSELATLIAGEEYSLFTFDGHKPRPRWGFPRWPLGHGRNRDLHITSHNFDHPDCVALAARHRVVLAIHGCKGETSQIFVGGLDEDLTMLLTRRLNAAGFPATSQGHQYPGRNRLNICNRGARGRGAQLELTLDLREPGKRAVIAPIVRAALTEYS